MPTGPPMFFSAMDPAQHMLATCAMMFTWIVAQVGLVCDAHHLTEMLTPHWLLLIYLFSGNSTNAIFFSWILLVRMKGYSRYQHRTKATPC